MKLGIIICTYERPLYLSECLNSILKSDIPDGTLFIVVDDGSTNPAVKELIISFVGKVGGIAIYNNHSGVHNSLLCGFQNALFIKGCDVVMNLDSDAIVHPDWIKDILELQQEHPWTIASGFNTLNHDHETQQPRHPIVDLRENYVTKRSIGGINMCFGKDVYFRFIRDNLKHNWDWLVCHQMQSEGNFFVVTTPSVVQHIGTEGMHVINPDISTDFKTLPCLKETI